MAPVLVFASFLPISKKNGMSFTTVRIFNTIALVNLATEPLLSLLQLLPQLAQAAGCLSRIQAYLLVADFKDKREELRLNTDSIILQDGNIPDTAKTGSSGSVFEIHNGTFSWETKLMPTLRNVNVKVPKGKVTMLFGPVGCGKTTLLHTFLGETVCTKGKVLCSSRRVAFCSQNPWLRNTTIHDAIVSYSEEDAEWYDQVVRACALDKDFATLEKGDEKMIGSGGSGLSGGQKQRVVSLCWDMRLKLTNQIGFGTCYICSTSSTHPG